MFFAILEILKDKCIVIKLLLFGSFKHRNHHRNYIKWCRLGRRRFNFDTLREKSSGISGKLSLCRKMKWFNTSKQLISLMESNWQAFQSVVDGSVKPRTHHTHFCPIPATSFITMLNVCKVFLTCTFRKWLFCAILCHYPTLSFQNLDEPEKGL